jgi:[ribosomal protein S18]-alanine N-acetyltransferase
MSALWNDEADSGAPPAGRVLLPMTTSQLDDVMAIEVAAYAFPWSRGNFIDSIAARYPARLLCDPTGALLGYFVAMVGVDEMHLLNITVAPGAQGRGHARFLIGALLDLCRAHAARELWLEVRESNARARRIYERMGFVQVGVRKGYYPAAAGRREDAVVMSFRLGAAIEALNAVE